PRRPGIGRGPAPSVGPEAFRQRCCRHRMAGGRGHRGRRHPVPVVPVGFRRGGPWHPRPLGCATAYGRRGPLPVGAQSHLPCRTPRRPRRSVVVPLATARRVRGRDGDLLPPVRGRVRRADAAPPLRRLLRGVPPDGASLDATPPRTSMSQGLPGPCPIGGAATVILQGRMRKGTGE